MDQRMETIFKLMNCNDVDKISLVEYQLDGNALYWWDASQGILFPEGMAVTWKGFTDVFNEKYFSSCAKDRKMEEFVLLTQKGLSMDQYEVKFAELPRYASRLIAE